MAITSGDWSSSTDPFILAESISWPSPVYGANSATLSNMPDGPLFWDLSDIENCDLRFVDEANADRGFNLTTHQISALNVGEGSALSREQPQFESDEGFSSYRDFYIYEMIPSPQGSITYTIGFSPKTQGSGNFHELYAYYAYAWWDKDPAQIVFSWIAHHVDSSLTLKDYLNQTSFEDASDYWDIHRLRLSCIREVGSTIADQIKKLFQHSVDFLTIRPDPTDGDVELFILPRRALDERTTVIELESSSVAEYTIRPTDRYTLDAVSARYGQWVGRNTAGGAIEQDYKFDASGAIADSESEYFSNTYQYTHRTKVGPESADTELALNLPYHCKRSNISSHFSMMYWRDDQEEIEIKFADLSHLNFEAGDLVHVSGRGLDGTESFLVFEKEWYLDDLTATARLLRLNGLEGKFPHQVNTADLADCFRPDTLGYFYNTNVITLPGSPDDELARPYERWMSEGEEYTAAWEFDRGTGSSGGGIPGMPSFDVDRRNGWPGWECNTFKGFQKDNDTSRHIEGITSVITAPTEWTAFFVINGDTTGTGAKYLWAHDGTPDLIFAFEGGGTANKVQFYANGSWKGSVDAINGWQILVFVLDDSGTFTAKIRRNGADIETGLNFSSQDVINTGGLCFDFNGNGNGFDGTFMEALIYGTRLADADIEAIEEHLAAKYEITI